MPWRVGSIQADECSIHRLTHIRTLPAFGRHGSGLLSRGAYVFVEYSPLAPLHKPSGGSALVSNVVNFDRSQRLHKHQVEQQRKIAEQAIARAKDEWKKLAQMQQRQR